MSERFSPGSALVVGGSAGLGRAIAAELAQRGYDLILSARDSRDLEAVAADCRERYGATVSILPVDLTVADSPRVLLDYCRAHSGSVNYLFLCAGVISGMDKGCPPRQVLTNLNMINYVQPAAIMSEFLENRVELNLGGVIVMSSISASAPRGRNVAYAAAKNALESFCKSMQVELAQTRHDGLRQTQVQIYRLGYVDTGLSFGEKLLFPVLSSEKAAKYIVDNLSKRFRVRYLPVFWRFVILVLANLPWTVYRRLNF